MGRSGGFKGGSGAGVLIIGGIFIGGMEGLANAAPALSDYARHLQQGEVAWADLDALSFAGRMTEGGADYLFTEMTVGFLMEVGDKVITGYP